jgi:hypothetical protein
VRFQFGQRNCLKETVQKIGVMHKELTVFRKTFEVIELNAFNENVIHAINSPMNKPKSLIFNIKKEKIDYRTEI